MRRMRNRERRVRSGTMRRIRNRERKVRSGMMRNRMRNKTKKNMTMNGVKG